MGRMLRLSRRGALAGGLLFSLSAAPARAERSLLAVDQISFVRGLFQHGVSPDMLSPDLRAALERDARRRLKRLTFDWLTGAKTPGARVALLDVAFARNREGLVIKATLPGDVQGELIIANFVCENQTRTRLFVLAPTPDSWIVVNVVLAPEHGSLLARLDPGADGDTGLNTMVAAPANTSTPRLSPSAH